MQKIQIDFVKYRSWSRQSSNWHKLVEIKSWGFFFGEINAVFCPPTRDSSWIVISKGICCGGGGWNFDAEFSFWGEVFLWLWKLFLQNSNGAGHSLLYLSVKYVNLIGRKQVTWPQVINMQIWLGCQRSEGYVTLSSPSSRLTTIPPLPLRLQCGIKLQSSGILDENSIQSRGCAFKLCS